MASHGGAFTAPTSFRYQDLAQSAYELPFRTFQNTHDSHPSLPNLCLLVFSAVLEVVCVSLPGYIVARLGHFDADKQKFLANLNVMLFTPCLIFTKLASQLNAKKLSDLAIIPAIFVIQTLVSWLVARVVAKLFRFNKRASNFITAMSVFGNSNSLPISLVISLSATLKGLHWDRIPGDNDDEVAARGILYLLIFQQLGQLVRWSWGYHVLLAPKDKYDEYQDHVTEEGGRPCLAHDTETRPLIDGLDGDTEDEDTCSNDSRHYDPAGRTPIASASRATLVDLVDNDDPKGKAAHKVQPYRDDPSTTDESEDHLSIPHVRVVNPNNESVEEPASSVKQWMHNKSTQLKTTTSDFFSHIYSQSPKPVQTVFSSFKSAAVKFNNFIWEFMNPPLWAMICAIVVASVPALQRLFFQEGSFVQNSVTSAIRSNGNVAVPLILVVLGANLARNTTAHDEEFDPEEEKIGKKLMIASLISRMLLPTMIMAPILALIAKYLPISILDDPIFVIVCFLLSGAPSALQLAQICQINNVYEKTMGKILFQSYVVWILPSTLILVMLALETVEWATAA
ncbi:unnamed protein product [Clonostachys rosea f. rosea IK726]|uniref:Transporter n=2 Tax=Bionectria ochroleuca TaxID=29856 RepID=A0A0B7KHT5_BIOOC|nr:unnamed protein product [Clonostachys rosea f. rosea IK726]